MLADWLPQLSQWLARSVGLLSAEAWSALLAKALAAVPAAALGTWAWKAISKWRAPYKAPSPKPTSFNILIADLTNDRRHARRRLLCKALDEWSTREGISLQVHALRRHIENKDFLGDEGRIRVAAEAQSWLNETGYDVLIWGIWSEAGGALPSYSLRFAARRFGFVEARKLAIPALTGYTLREMKLLTSLPKGLPRNIGDFIGQAASHFLIAASNLEDDAQGEVLSKAQKKAMSVLDLDPSLISEELRAGLRMQMLVSLLASIRDLPSEDVAAYGAWLEKQSAQAPDSDAGYWRIAKNMFEMEIAANAPDPQEALILILERKRADILAIPEGSLEWRIAQYEVGTILNYLGATTDHQAYFHDAIQPLRLSLSESGLDASPEERERALLMLGRALHNAGREAYSDRELREAIAVLKEALQCQTSRSKIIRHDVLEELASTYESISHREVDHGSVAIADTYYERAIAECTPPISLADWLGLHYLHGIALFYIGNRSGDHLYLKRAREKLEYVLEQGAANSKFRLSNAAMSSLANVHAAIWSISDRNLSPDGAIKSYRTAIDNIPKRDEAHWSLVRENFAMLLHSIGQRTGSATYFMEAEEMLRAALGALAKDARPHQWANAQINLARVLLDIGTRSNDLSRIDEALAISETVLAELSVVDNENAQNKVVLLLQACKDARRNIS